jgi:hypothetical protein
MDATLEDRVTVVSHALPKWYALGRAWWRDFCLGPSDWRRLCALSLSATYSVLLVLASLCVATGLFHAAAPHGTHHHHADSAAAHHHAAPDARHASPVPDICDIVHQVCTTLVLWAVPLPTLTLSSGPAPVKTVCSFVDSLLPSSCSIRAPPVVIS